MNYKDEFINKKDLLQELANEIYKFDSVDGEFQRGVDWALRMIIKHPTADVEEVEHGIWLESDPYPSGIRQYTCSCCGRSLYARPWWDLLLRFPYCHCGARMHKEDEQWENERTTSD